MFFASWKCNVQNWSLILKASKTNLILIHPIYLQKPRFYHLVYEWLYRLGSSRCNKFHLKGYSKFKRFMRNNFILIYNNLHIINANRHTTTSHYNNSPLHLEWQVIVITCKISRAKYFHRWTMPWLIASSSFDYLSCV